MDIKIPKILTNIDLGGYDNALSGKFLTVWLNPTLALLREHDAVMHAKKPEDEKITEEEKAALDRKNEVAMNSWYARLWSQGADAASHWTADEIDELNEKDPTLLAWMIRATWEVRSEHARKKKKS